MNVPKLRFKEFNDEWCYQSLSKYVNRITTKNKNNESDLVLTISAQYGLVDQTFFFNRSVSSSNLTGYYLLNNGDFAYNKSYSNGYPWGAVKRLNKYNQGVVSSLYICFKTNNLIDSNFLEQYFETNKWYQQISEVSVEGARNHGLLNIAVNDFFNTKHYIPSIKEQEKISKFLSLLDKKIELQTKKIEDLKLFKLKSFEIMIREINEYKKIKQIGSLKNGYSFKNNLYDGKGLYNILTISNVTGNLYINNNFKNKYNFIPKDIQNHQILKEKDILISMTGNVGRVSFNKGKNNLLNQRVGVLELNESINRDYIFYMLSNKKFENKMIDCGQGAAQLNITKTDIENYKIPYPNKQKQLKITKILNYITQKIQLEENKLLKLKELKNGLMQNMFV